MSVETTIHEKNDGIQIKFLITTNAKQTRILGYDKWQEGIKVAVAAQPQKGKANRELLSFLAKVFSVPKNKVFLVSGEKSTKKVVELGGIGRAQAVKILQI